MKTHHQNKRIQLAALITSVASCWWYLFPVRQPDYFLYLVPWLSAIRESRGLTIFSTDFANYTGGYVTVLWLVERLNHFANGSLSDLAVIKITALVGSVLCSCAAWSLLRSHQWRREDALLAAVGVLLLPEVLLNGVAWAQADALSTFFLVFAVGAMIRDRPYLASACFALAISTKLQAIWLAPLFAAWILRYPRAILPAIIAVPIAYAVVNALYLVAGRPVQNVLFIYFNQFGTFARLSMSAPNPWYVFGKILDPKWVSTNYTFLVITGMTAASVAGLWIMRRVHALRSKSPELLLHWAAMSAILIPYLLPKMHERFFFAAGIFTYLLAVIDRRYVLPAVMIQLAAILSYSQYHDTLHVSALLGRDVAMSLAFAFMTVAVWKMLKLSDQQSQDVSVSAVQFPLPRG